MFNSKLLHNMLTVVERQKRMAKSRAGTSKTIKSGKVVKLDLGGTGKDYVIDLSDTSQLKELK